MNIYVCIKQVPDTETRVRLTSDNKWIETSGIKWIMSPYDEYAVEEAIRLKDKNLGSTVTVISAGPDRVMETIRNALAMGADNGIHIEIPETSDSNLTAKALEGALKHEENVNIIFTGKEAIDDGASQVSQLLAENLDIPCVIGVLHAEYSMDKVKCKREAESGVFEIIEAMLPAIIAAEKGLNEPRYATIPNIMKAKKKEIKKLSMSGVGVSETDQKIFLKDLRLPLQKQPVKIITGNPESQGKELAQIICKNARLE